MRKDSWLAVNVVWLPHDFPHAHSTPLMAASPVGDAMTWAARIMAIGLVMFLPAVVGGWLDERLGTAFLAPVGLVLGFIAGLTWLVQLQPRRKQ
jgi:uncharacterized membrane protein YgdD (TMEM256/DUF423 family)